MTIEDLIDYARYSYSYAELEPINKISDNANEDDLHKSYQKMIERLEDYCEDD